MLSTESTDARCNVYAVSPRDNATCTAVRSTERLRPFRPDVVHDAEWSASTWALRDVYARMALMWTGRAIRTIALDVYRRLALILSSAAEPGHSAFAVERD